MKGERKVRDEVQLRGRKGKERNEVEGKGTGKWNVITG